MLAAATSVQQLLFSDQSSMRDRSAWCRAARRREQQAWRIPGERDGRSL